MSPFPNANFSNIPAPSPPSEVVPNLTSSSSMKKAIITVNFVFLGLMMGFLITQLYVRRYLQQLLGWDDCWQFD